MWMEEHADPATLPWRGRRARRRCRLGRAGTLCGCVPGRGAVRRAPLGGAHTQQGEQGRHDEGGLPGVRWPCLSDATAHDCPTQTIAITLAAAGSWMKENLNDVIHDVKNLFEGNAGMT